MKRAVSFLDYSTGGLAAVANARDGLPFYERHNMLGGRLAGVSIPHREMYWSLDSGRNLLAEFLDYDRRTRLVGEYLPKVDGGTMHYALEARSPLLDTQLWEYATRIPYRVRLHNGQSKAVLREIARRRIGEAVANGAKRGFNIPAQAWLTGGWRQQFIDTMSDAILEKEGWIKTKPVFERLRCSEPRNWAPRQLWFIFVLESWLRFEKGLRFQ